MTRRSHQKLLNCYEFKKDESVIMYGALAIKTKKTRECAVMFLCSFVNLF